MRKAEGEDYGDILLPVGVPTTETPEKALSDNKRYQVVWEVLQALRSHDDRFNATVNQIAFNRNRAKNILVGSVSGKDFDGTQEGLGGQDGTGQAGAGGEGATGADEAVQEELDYDWGEQVDGVCARMVSKVGERCDGE